jgi:transposase
VTERLRVREIDDDEGKRLVRVVRRGSGSVVTWRRAQMVLLSAQGMDAAAIAKVAFTSEDRVRDVIRNFNADGFSSLYPKYKGGRPPKFTLAQRREIKKIAKSRPAEHGLPFSAWSLSKLAEFLVAEGVGRRHQPRGPAHAAPRGRRHLSTDKDLESLEGPGLRGEEGPGGAPVRDR